jgi:membrane protease subunit (stomatin/prohibitin family)
MAFAGLNAADAAGSGDMAAILAAQAQQREQAAKMTAPSAGWACPKCGATNTGKFCTECGTKKPAGVPQYKCDKCGWEPADPTKPPKFCPECGDPFDDGDIK